VPGAFSSSTARTVYEAIANARYDPAFARDLNATGLIQPTEDVRSEGLDGRHAVSVHVARVALGT
jgi:hypothetical protein